MAWIDPAIVLGVAGIASTWHISKRTLDRAAREHAETRADQLRARHQDEVREPYNLILRAVVDLREWATCQIGPHPMTLKASDTRPRYEMGTAPPPLPAPILQWSDDVLSRFSALKHYVGFLLKLAELYVDLGPVGPEGTSSYNAQAAGVARDRIEVYGSLTDASDELITAMRNELNADVSDTPDDSPTPARPRWWRRARRG